MESVTHIAGVRLDIGGRVIQRCSLCGEKLIDNLNESVPIGPDSKVSETYSWPIGRLVRVTFGNPRRSLLLEDTDKLTDDSCISLIE
jgi:hypothetical protein